MRSATWACEVLVTALTSVKEGFLPVSPRAVLVLPSTHSNSCRGMEQETLSLCVCMKNI